MNHAAVGRWIELGDGVFARRYSELDLSVGLVLGTERCLVVDTRGDAEQGAEFAAAVREITPLPWTVVLTHDHYDHAHGVSAFLPCAVWAHQACWDALQDVEQVRDRMSARVVESDTELDLGGRRVLLRHPGVAHTAGDVVVHVPDVGVLFAGDLVEHVPGGSFSAESFGDDTALAGWPAALSALLELDITTVVPGHGEPTDPEFIRTCRDILSALLTLRRAVRAGELTHADAVARSPLPDYFTLAALTKPVA